MLRYVPLVVANSVRNLRRSVLTALSIAASVCLLGLFMTVYYAFFVTAPPPGQALRLVARNRASIAGSLPRSYLDRIRQVPGVREATIFQWFGGIYKDRRDVKNKFARFAVEAGKLFVVHPEYRIPEENGRAFVRERTSCVLGRALAHRLNLRVGDRLTLIGDIFPIDRLDLVIRGIYDSEHDNDNLFFHYEYLTESLPPGYRDRIGMFTILAKDAESVPEVAAEIDHVFRNAPVETRTEGEKNFELGFLDYLGNVKLFLIGVCGALSFTLLLVSGNTMAMSVRERVREVGILRTLGFTPAHILGMIVGESASIALAGGLLGVALAAGLVEGMRRWPSQLIDLQSLSFRPEVAAASLILALLVGALSSLWPAWTVSRRPIVEALRFTD